MRAVAAGAAQADRAGHRASSPACGRAPGARAGRGRRRLVARPSWTPRPPGAGCRGPGGSTGASTSRRGTELLARAWLMVLPSVREGWGIAVLEAAAQGTPTVAYRAAGGVTESVRPTASPGCSSTTWTGLVEATARPGARRDADARWLGARASGRSSFDWDTATRGRDPSEGVMRRREVSRRRSGSAGRGVGLRGLGLGVDETEHGHRPSSTPTSGATRNLSTTDSENGTAELPRGWTGGREHTATAGRA